MLVSDVLVFFLFKENALLFRLKESFILWFFRTFSIFFVSRSTKKKKEINENIPLTSIFFI